MKRNDREEVTDSCSVLPTHHLPVLLYQAVVSSKWTCAGGIFARLIQIAIWNVSNRILVFDIAMAGTKNDESSLWFCRKREEFWQCSLNTQLFVQKQKQNKVVQLAHGWFQDFGKKSRSLIRQTNKQTNDEEQTFDSRERGTEANELIMSCWEMWIVTVIIGLSPEQTFISQISLVWRTQNVW